MAAGRVFRAPLGGILFAARRRISLAAGDGGFECAFGGRRHGIPDDYGHQRRGHGKSLDEVITHEVGHNWFYGWPASNERDHPWIYEGMNSYYERAYMTEYYQSDVTDDMVPSGVD